MPSVWQSISQAFEFWHMNTEVIEHSGLQIMTYYITINDDTIVTLGEPQHVKTM